jgi:hypothetical protein
MIPFQRWSVQILVAVLIIVCLGWSATGQGSEPSGKAIRLLERQQADGELPGWKSFSETADTKTSDVWKLDADGVLVCRGTPKGYLATIKEYQDFVLKVQWRWPPQGKAGNGGVLVRITGPDKIWPRSLEAQINAGQAGDFWGLAGYSLTGPADRSKEVVHPQFGRLKNVKKAAAMEKPTGQWNSYEIVVKGDTATLSINGQQVNAATGCDVVRGRLCLTAEGDEIHYRNVELTPLDK